MVTNKNKLINKCRSLKIAPYVTRSPNDDNQNYRHESPTTNASHQPAAAAGPISSYDPSTIVQQTNNNESGRESVRSVRPPSAIGSPSTRQQSNIARASPTEQQRSNDYVTTKEYTEEQQQQQPSAYDYERTDNSAAGNQSQVYEPSYDTATVGDQQQYQTEYSDLQQQQYDQQQYDPNAYDTSQQGYDEQQQQQQQPYDANQQQEYEQYPSEYDPSAYGTTDAGIYDDQQQSNVAAPSTAQSGYTESEQSGGNVGQEYNSGQRPIDSSSERPSATAKLLPK